MPSLRSKFTGFLKYFGPKADTGAVIINSTPSSSPSSRIGNCISVNPASNVLVPHSDPDNPFNMLQMEFSTGEGPASGSTTPYNVWIGATFFFHSWYNEDLANSFPELKNISKESCLTIMPPNPGVPGYLGANYTLQRNFLMPSGWMPGYPSLKKDISIDTAPAAGTAQATLGKDGNLAYAQSFQQSDSNTFSLNTVKEGKHVISAAFLASNQAGSPDLGGFPALGTSTITINVATLGLKLTEQTTDNNTQEISSYDNTDNTITSIAANQEKTYQAQWTITKDETTRAIQDVLGEGNLNGTIKLEYLENQPEVYFTVCDQTNPATPCPITEDEAHRLTTDRKDLTFTNNQSTIKFTAKTSGKFKLIFQPKVDNINSSLANSVIKEVGVKVNPFVLKTNDCGEVSL